MTETTRDRALRALLVDRVDRSVRRRRWLVPTIGVGAFVVAGSLTAGALVGTGLLQQSLTPEDASALVATGAAGDVTLLGSPVVRVTDGSTTLTLPGRPSGARDVAVGLQCAPPGTATVTIGTGDGGVDPTTADCGASVTLPVGADTAGRPTVRVEHDGPMTVWASWARPDPIPGPSPEQQAALEDGVVTRFEYVAAWDRYVGCMRASGHPVDLGPLQPVVIVSGIPTEALQADSRCGASELLDVDAMWQNEHPDAEPYTPAAGAPYDPASDPRYAG
ncbi:hypothetical protein DEJ24_04280 [Curtobacterium sp. MCPF17_001]|uniref:hypothetical protein n=1 Tax=Curtobacterium sp. MCPF17_001 TaxID=2175651 RepID=UPI000DA80B09|nr:hypothetical protein [Curtobacterium sp. MCPF17_001]PZE61493.1 hypothetical protein DEJ24_04280 [Curtobacterium sp. MCPF17_001]